jgi:hypothetical protein
VKRRISSTGSADRKGVNYMAATKKAAKKPAKKTAKKK